MNKWWIYQRERFPVFANGLLILVFSVAAVCYSHALRGAPGFPAWQAMLTAFVNSFCAFLQLRLADEFKDFDEDSRHRPYRPVPRGLVALRELGVVWIVSGLVQLVATMLFDWRLVALLVVQWTYLGLMSREFFLRDWLKARPFTYMWSHMLIMPIIDFFATACDWLPAKSSPPHGLEWFVAASFFNGMVIEIGRKIRSPADEENGVQTYTRDWGVRGACMGFVIVLVLAAATAWFASSAARIPNGLLIVPMITLAIASLLISGFSRRLSPGFGKRFEILSGAWTLALYLWLGSAILF